MTEEQPQLRNSTDQQLYLLGVIQGEMRAARELQAQAQAAQSHINSAHDAEHAALRGLISDLTTALAIVKEQLPKRAPWYLVVGGVTGIVSGIGGFIALFAILNRLSQVNL